MNANVNIFKNMHMWRGGGEVGTFRMWDTRKILKYRMGGVGRGSKVTGLILDTLSLASIPPPPLFPLERDREHNSAGTPHTVV